MNDTPGDGGVWGENAEEMDEKENDRLGMVFIESEPGAT
jgi:hypothetical protein